MCDVPKIRLRTDFSSMACTFCIWCLLTSVWTILCPIELEAWPNLLLDWFYKHDYAKIVFTPFLANIKMLFTVIPHKSGFDTLKCNSIGHLFKMRLHKCLKMKNSTYSVVQGLLPTSLLMSTEAVLQWYSRVSKSTEG